ncbi:MAG TPA: TOMM precursor leader peptide-binding protein [Roseiflexaceae bacterium]|nr:TOMM precursor leader peptide-binding protein [Roseiflexaceae bacterium]
MIQRPAFRSDLHPVLLPPDKVFLVGESKQFVVSGRSSLLVAQQIDGRRSTDEIVAALSRQVSVMQVYYVLALLEQQGYIHEALPDLPPGRAAYWSALGIDPHNAEKRLARARVRLAAVGTAPTEPLAAQLAAHGLPVGDDDSDLLVVLTDDYLHDELSEHNLSALRRGTPWMLVRPSGVELWVGPLFRPGHTGCWACLSQRLRANRDVEVYLQSLAGRPRPFQPLAALPAAAALCLEVTALEILRWTAGGSSTVEGKVLSIHSGSMRTEEHVLVRRPQCPQCGTPLGQADRPPTPITFAARRKVHVFDTSHRSTAPEAMIRAYQHHISPITGIVRQLERQSPPDDAVRHTYVSGRNIALPLDTETITRKTPRSSSGGKGTSDIQARASALGEAIERYSGTFRGEEPCRTATLHELGPLAVDPQRCMNFSEKQYRQREHWNRAGTAHRTVPLPFDPDAPMQWTPLWSLTHREPRYLPTSYCYYAYPRSPEAFYCGADSNGCAAGSTIEEAVLHGLLELVERDSTALWWYNRLRRPAIDLESFDDPYIRLLLDDYGHNQRRVWVLDLTSDIGIPACVALSCRTDEPGARIGFAPAAHLDPRVAVLRALTELNQLMPTVRDDGVAEVYEDEDFNHWWNHVRVNDQPYLLPDPHLPPRRPADFPQLGADTLRGDLLLCQSLVERQGMELLVLDQTRPDIGMPVVRVVVPGMRHFWARLGPGRLYDVPVKLGWLDTPLREEQLNPVPFFI